MPALEENTDLSSISAFPLTASFTLEITISLTFGFHMKPGYS